MVYFGGQPSSTHGLVKAHAPKLLLHLEVTNELIASDSTGHFYNLKLIAGRQFTRLLLLHFRG
jgi:hypothetical protein